MITMSTKCPWCSEDIHTNLHVFKMIWYSIFGSPIFYCKDKSCWDAENLANNISKSLTASFYTSIRGRSFGSLKPIRGRDLLKIPEELKDE